MIKRFNYIATMMNSTACGALLALVLCIWVLQHNLPLSADVGWLLYAAERFINGAELYTDIVEINPPLIIYLSTMPVYISEIFNVHSITTFRLLFIGFILFCAYIYSKQLKNILGTKNTAIINALVLSQIFIHGVLVFFEMGQREQIVTLLINIYLLHVCSQLIFGLNVLKKRLAVASIAALAIALKPFFLTIVIACEVLLMVRSRSFLYVFRYENVLFVALGILYLLSVLIFHPQYYSFIIPAASKLYFAYTLPIAEIIKIPHLVLALCMLHGYWLLRKNTRFVYLWLTLFIGASAGYASYLLQRTEWPYHLIPFITFALSAWLLGLFVFIANNKILQTLASYWAKLKYLKMSTMLLICCGLFYLWMNSWNEDITIADTFHIPSQNQQIDPGHFARTKIINKLQNYPGADSFYIITNSVGPAFSIINHTNAQWASRFAHLWMLPGIIRQHERKRPASVEDLQALENYLRSSVNEDLKKFRPSLILVETTNKKQALEQYQFDHLKYFLQDEQFQEIWRNYRKIDEYTLNIGQFSFPYDIYQSTKINQQNNARP